MTPPPSRRADSRSRLRAFITDVKTIVAFLLFLGYAGATWASSLATKEDVAREHDLAAGERSTMRLATSALAERVTRSEVDLDWIKSTLFAIAQKTGATNVPPPPP